MFGLIRWKLQWSLDAEKPTSGPWWMKVQFAPGDVTVVIVGRDNPFKDNLDVARDGGEIDARDDRQDRSHRRPIEPAPGAGAFIHHCENQRMALTL
jgi:hypothetical protein